LQPILAILAFVFGFFLLAWLILHLKRPELKISQAQITDVDYLPDSIQIKQGCASNIRNVTIDLDQCAVGVEESSLFQRRARKTIFKPITTTFEPGVLNVIMAPSGGGKTSLLNYMARRLHSTLRTKYCSSGKVLFNGCVATDSVIRSICSYVPQDDEGLLPFLTVRETLRFAARLRLPSWMSKSEKMQRAESMLLRLGLKDCADTIVGSDLVRGISGGERRRVSIAIQILTDPRVLLLDEPTSGLDAFTASSIIEVLRGLALEGRTIILTLHQTRSDLFKEFGTILLLARGGDVVYSGQASGMLRHFDSVGFKCPETTNPSDFALDLITVDLRKTSSEAITGEKVDALISSWGTVQRCSVQGKAEISAPAALGSMAQEKSPFHIALPILIHRGIINLLRQPNLATGRISQLLGLAIVETVFFAPLGNDYYSVQSRMGFVQQLSAVFFVGMLNSIALYPNERAIFYREDDDNSYPLEAFFIYYSALEIPMELLASMLFSLLTVLAVGLPRTPALFFLTTYITFCVVSCGESVGIVFLTLLSHTGLAVSIMSVILAISVHLGGIISLSVPGFLQALNHASPVKWQVGALASYSLRGIEFACSNAQRLADGKCPIENGGQALALYHLDVDTGKYALALGGVTVGYRLLAYVVLKARRTRWRDFLG
jgi:ABC-type multidrug transport system ATPase subunit